MTEPELERATARAEADAAFSNASEVRERGAKIARGWTKSRQDNNFRQMLRAISSKAESSAS